MLQFAPSRRFPSNSPHPGWPIVGMLILAAGAGAVAATVGLLLRDAAAAQAAAIHSATSSAIDITNHALLVGTIWTWSGAIAIATGVTILAIVLRASRR